MLTSSPSTGQTQLTLAGKGLAQSDHTGFQRWEDSQWHRRAYGTLLPQQAVEHPWMKRVRVHEPYWYR
jgi:hypothetical protein